LHVPFGFKGSFQAVIPSNSDIFERKCSSFVKKYQDCKVPGFHGEFKVSRNQGFGFLGINVSRFRGSMASMF
jgi:hypothetical protein